LGLGGMAGWFAIMTESGADELGQLLNYSLAALKGRRPVYCLLPEYQVQLQSVLEGRGFYRVAEYSCLYKQLAVRVSEPQLVPLHA
jgi:hypothetical protein